MQALTDVLVIDKAQLGNGGDSVLHETRSFEAGRGVDWQAGTRTKGVDAGISGPRSTRQQKKMDGFSLVSGLVQEPLSCCVALEIDRWMGVGDGGSRGAGRMRPSHQAIRTQICEEGKEYAGQIKKERCVRILLQ